MKSSVIATLVALASLQYGSAALVAHLTFDDPTDLLKNTGSGTIVWGGSVGITAEVDGKFGGALSLTTTSDVYSNQAGTALGTDLNLFTVGMHVRQIPGGANQMLNWQDFASFGDDNNSTFKFEFTGDTKKAALYSDGSPGGGTVNIGPSATGSVVNVGGWHHLAMVSDGAFMSFYIDGALQGSAAYTGTGALDAIQLAGAYGAGRKQNVQIDDLAIWNEALTADQIAGISSSAIPEPTSVALLGLSGLGLLLRRRR